MAILFIRNNTNDRRYNFFDSIIRNPLLSDTILFIYILLHFLYIRNTIIHKKHYYVIYTTFLIYILLLHCKNQ